MSIHAYICLYFSYPSICGSKLFSSTHLEIGGISAHMNMLHTSGHKGWPYLSQLCTPAKAALWSKTRVTGDPTSAIFPVCSFSLQSSPGLIPLAEYLFSAGTFYENLWRKFYSFFFLPKESISHVLRQLCTANQSTVCRESWESCIEKCPPNLN